MRIFKYRDYDHYVLAQKEANEGKIDLVWVTFETIKKIVLTHGVADSVLCHGTRNGAEQQLFRACYPSAKIVGTEISDTASLFPMTIQWDMQTPNEEWAGKFDIVYSNSFDHAIYPAKTMLTWLEQLSPDGRLYLEHANDPRSNFSSVSDPLEISDSEMEYLIGVCGGSIVNTFPTYGRDTMPTKVYSIRKAK